MIIDLPGGRQSFDFDCGAKALQLVMAYYGVDIREDSLIEALKCSSQGTPLENMISFARQQGFDVIAKSGMTLDQIKDFVDQKTPVIVLIQAWANKIMALEDWKNDYDNGHYAIVIGHDGPIIVFEDPASFRKTWLTEEEFVTRWHDIDPATGAKLDQFALVLLGKEPVPSHQYMEHMD